MPFKIISLKQSDTIQLKKSAMCFIKRNKIILSIDIIHLLFISETKNLFISTSHLKYKKSTSLKNIEAKRAPRAFKDNRIKYERRIDLNNNKVHQRYQNRLTACYLSNFNR